MRPRSLFALALIAVFAGCNSSDSVTPQVDVDAALSQITLGAGAFADFGVATSLPGPAMHAADCAYDAASAFFKCTPVTSNGVTFARQFQLLDATGAPLSSIDPLTVASIRSVSDLSGTEALSEGGVDVDVQITRHDDATLSGLQSANRVLNGKATQLFAATSAADTFTMTDTTTTTNLQLPATRAQKYPLGGSVLSSGAIQSGTDPVEKYSIEVTFDGTSFVTVKSNFGGLTESCRYNLALPNSDPVCV